MFLSLIWFPFCCVPHHLMNYGVFPCFAYFLCSWVLFQVGLYAYLDPFLFSNFHLFPLFTNNVWVRVCRKQCEKVKELMNSVKGKTVMMHGTAPATNGMCDKMKETHSNAYYCSLMGFGWDGTVGLVYSAILFKKNITYSFLTLHILQNDLS